MHSSSTNCTVCNLQTSGNGASQGQNESVWLQNNLQPVNCCIGHFLRFHSIIYSYLHNTNSPTTCYYKLQVRRLAGFKGSKDIIRRRARRLWPVKHDGTYQMIHVSAANYVMRLKKHGIMDVTTISCDIHHWIIPLYICISNRHITHNKQKLHRSFLVAPIQL